MARVNGAEDVSLLLGCVLRPSSARRSPLARDPPGGVLGEDTTTGRTPHRHRGGLNWRVGGGEKSVIGGGGGWGGGGGVGRGE